MIEEVVWNVGANGKNIAYDRILSNTFYELERGNGTGKICSSGNSCNDNIKRTTKWIGNIGLIYPSDYGMAVEEELSQKYLPIDSSLIILSLVSTFPFPFSTLFITPIIRHNSLLNVT